MKDFFGRIIERRKRRIKLLALKRRLLAKHKPNKNLAKFRLAH